MEIGQLAQLGGTVVVVVLFLVFLRQLIEKHNETTNKHFEALMLITNKSNDINQELSKELQRFSDVMINLEKVNNEQTTMIKSMYKQFKKGK